MHRLAIFGKQGLSYSPLYPLVLAPLYALHLSGPDAYLWTKIVNCFLLALAALPVYAIARYVLTPGRALVAATLSTALPLMLYSALEMSENLAYPARSAHLLGDPRDAPVAALDARCARDRALRACGGGTDPVGRRAARGVRCAVVLDGLLAPGPAWRRGAARR